jgi:imidazole glycerol-phosphate synthase subunit HisH
MTVGIIDYGVGNLGSVFRALESIDSKAKILNKPSDLSNVSKIILPGVGNFTDCKRLLDNSGWSDSLHYHVLEGGLPMLGICIGMHLLAEYGVEGSSEDQSTPGLGFISGSVESLKKLGCCERVPHMGWNSVVPRIDASLFVNIPKNTDFYFVHSYAFVPKSDDHATAFTTHGVDIVAALKKDHIYGTQFHPEKSSRAGLTVLRNFLNASQC